MTVRRALMRTFMSPFARDMVPIPVSGRVVATEFGNKLPDYDRLFSPGSLFAKSAPFPPLQTVHDGARAGPARDALTYPVPVRLERAANIYTIHDLVPLRLPGTSLEDKRYYDALIEAAAHDADAICTVSEASRRDILDLSPTDPDKVINTWQPVDIAEALDEDLPTPCPPARPPVRSDAAGLFPLLRRDRAQEECRPADRGLSLRRYRHAARRRRAAGNRRNRSACSAPRTARRCRPAPVSASSTISCPLLIELIWDRAVLFLALRRLRPAGAGGAALGAPLPTSRESSLLEVGDAALDGRSHDVAAIAAGLRQLDQDAGLRARLALQAETGYSEFQRRVTARRSRLSIASPWRAGVQGLKDLRRKMVKPRLFGRGARLRCRRPRRSC